MKQETNNEIDLLLRRMSRRQEVPLSDADYRIDSDHLDADELSAYAENALPAAARARYTEHLADCSKCREIVVQLSATVPVVAARETVPAAEPFGLRKFLASFFSPMVLRYAAPALGLIVVAAIGFVVLQSSNRSPRTVAQLEQPVQSPDLNASTQETPASSFYSYNSASGSASPSVSRQSTAKPATEAAQDPPPPGASKATGDLAAAKTDSTGQRVEQPVVANAAPAQPQSSPTPAETVNDMRVDVQGRRNEAVTVAQSRDLARAKLEEREQEEQKKAEAPQTARRRGAAAPAAGTASVQGAGTDSTFNAGQSAEKDRDDGVTRSVAGRRFRRQGGVWVDTAYTASSAITNVARGSEQFKALVADEPDIKKIADELDGPVVVVWKGRTYRIR